MAVALGPMSMSRAAGPEPAVLSAPALPTTTAIVEASRTAETDSSRIEASTSCQVAKLNLLLA